MLNNLTLTNFRKHQNLSVDFTPGMNVIRAANEFGKSSLIESVAYSLFGSRSLRTPIEQTVTWGEAVGDFPRRISCRRENTSPICECLAEGWRGSPTF